MKYELTVRARPSPGNDLEARHSAFATALASLPPPWRLPSDLPFPQYRSEVGSAMSLTRHLGKGVRGSLFYDTPGPHRDSCGHDHVLELTFQANRTSAQDACLRILPAYAAAFQAYVGHVGIEELLHHDFPLPESKVDFRHQVFRIHQAMFLDKVLIDPEPPSGPDSDLLESRRRARA